jgi:hypothetical protein
MFLKQLVQAFVDLVVSERARKPITCYEGGKNFLVHSRAGLSEVARCWENYFLDFLSEI